MIITPPIYKIVGIRGDNIYEDFYSSRELDGRKLDRLSIQVELDHIYDVDRLIEKLEVYRHCFEKV